jgi:hypothetical protein
MRRAPVPGLDLGIYAKAVPLLLRNPAIVVIPLLMGVIGVLIALITPPGGGILGNLTSQLGSFVAILLQLFGLGAACIMADDAWRHGRASFDKGWTEARRRGGEILYAALGVTLLLAVASYAGSMIGPLALLLLAAAVVFLIWAIPAASVGGIPGGAAIQISVDRVRATPVPAALAAVIAIALIFLAQIAAFQLAIVLLPALGYSLIVESLISALLKAVAVGYIALIVTKTYTDSAFGRRW